MSARRHLNPDQFRMQSDTDSSTHGIYTYHPDFGAGQVPVGSLYWDKNSGTVTSINVQDQYRKQGIGTMMYKHAQSFDPPAVHHDAVKTGMGKRFFAGIDQRGV